MKHNAVTILSIIVAVSLLVLFYKHGHFIFFIGSVMVCLFYLFIVAMASGNIRWNYFIDSIHRGKDKNSISITFDDGPDPKYTPLLLDELERLNIQATFFLIGEKVKNNPGLTQLILEKGHIIGNHSYSHTKKLTIASKIALKKDFKKCSRVIYQTTHKTVVYARPPFGVTNPKFDVLDKLNLKSIGWSLRSLDTAIKEKGKLYERIKSRLKGGQILLFHDTCPHSREILKDLLDLCEKKGIKIVPLDKHINVQPYAND